MNKLTATLFALALLFVASPVNAQALSQNQIIPPAYFGGGLLISTSTSPVAKLAAVATSTLNISTTNIVEGAKLFFTNARAIAATLTGYTAGAGTVSSSDSILTAIQKLDGNIAAKLSNITGLITAGTNVTITGSGTSGSPYVINATGTGGGGTISTSSPLSAGLLVQSTGVNTIANIATSTLGLLTTDIAEGSKQFFTNARAIAATLTGFTSGAGTISSSDTILSAIQKLDGNIATKISNITGLVTAGTNVTITGSGTSGSPYVINSSGSGGSGAISTSTALANGQVDFSTGVNTIGNDSAFAWDNTNKRLGIGSSTPAATLSVSTASGQSGLLPLFSVASTTNATILTVLGNGNVGIGSTSPSARLSLRGAGNTTGKLLDFSKANGTQTWTMLDSGNVGYGTTTPSQILRIMDSGNPTYGSVAVMTPLAGDPWGGMSVGTGIGFYYGTSIVGSAYVDNGGNFKIGAIPSGVPQYITFTSSGIGMTKVVLNGVSQDFAPLIALDTTPGFEAGFTLPAADTIGMVTARTERLRIDPTGNIGIGTTTPYSKLSLTGTSGSTAPIFTVASSTNASYFGVNSTGAITFASQTGTLGQILQSQGSAASPQWVSTSTLGLGTVSSVALTTPTGLTVSGSPITTSGTLALSLTAGYTIPLTASTTDWQTAFTNRITSLTNTGTGVATLSGNVLNIPLYGATTTSNTWAGTQTFTNAPIFSSLTGVLKGNGAGALTVATNGTDYTLLTAQSCTNQVITALTAAGGSTCSTVSNAMLANSTISGIALGSNLAALTATDSTLTFSGSYNGGTARTIGLNLANANSWSGLQTFTNVGTTTFSGGIQAATAKFTGLVEFAAQAIHQAQDLFNAGIRIAASQYINFGATTGSSGYGIRDNGGTIELKNSGGSWSAPGAPGLNGYQVFAVGTTTFSVPGGFTKFKFRIIGGGGPGGYCRGNTTAMGGGGGADFQEGFLTITGTSTVQVHVAATSTAGLTQTNGDWTTIGTNGSYAYAMGGVMGSVYNGGGSAGNQGGAASQSTGFGGLTNIAGQDGMDGHTWNTFGAGDGGNSAMGSGGHSHNSGGGDGTAGFGFGSGGSGATCGTGGTFTQTGGNGMPGFAIIEW